MTQQKNNPDDRAAEETPTADEAVLEAANETVTDTPSAAETPLESPETANREEHKKKLHRRHPEVDELKERLLRLQADFDNYRKRMQRERNELHLAANESILREVLPALDHFDLAQQAAASDPAAATAPFAQGFKLAVEQLRAALSRAGLTPFDATGTFNPLLHEAISHLPSDTIEADGILHQVRRGYNLGDRLLRPAQVVVSNGSPSAATPAQQEE